MTGENQPNIIFVIESKLYGLKYILYRSSGKYYAKFEDNTWNEEKIYTDGHLLTPNQLLRMFSGLDPEVEESTIGKI